MNCARLRMLHWSHWHEALISIHCEQTGIEGLLLPSTGSVAAALFLVVTRKLDSTRKQKWASQAVESLAEQWPNIRHDRRNSVVTSCTKRKQMPRGVRAIGVGTLVEGPASISNQPAFKRLIFGLRGAYFRQKIGS
ncbi:hypothetical protein BD410DRAFT_522111 [Rickenella mellea]|uniref:Uncharacterized protein n=1 Tax=Rickenella mellea TaxID=50990 RepID=A0A4Y7QI41_9AGAM|nr:hypothetical protein BD410DRAFT_522111 [Rickenella mellea]